MDFYILRIAMKILLDKIKIKILILILFYIKCHILENTLESLVRHMVTPC